jgi:hypothetical protein
MVGLRYLPKRIMSTFVDTLNSAFVRFIYISEDNERRTKIFGDKLGLETVAFLIFIWSNSPNYVNHQRLTYLCNRIQDWNSMITLRDPDPNEKKNKKNVGGIEKLPVGISAIQHHIDEVDNVPLLVKLFCDATPEAKSELVRFLNLVQKWTL